MDIILVIDISGSMTGHKIASVTDALENLKLSLLNISQGAESANIGIELFSRDVRWLNETMVPIDEFEWEEPYCTGMTSLGAACLSLSDFFRKNLYLVHPKIVLISDGCPTDDYEEGLRDLSENNIFKDSDRYAIGIGEEADIEALTKFTDDRHNVVTVMNLDDLLDNLTKAVIPISEEHTEKTNKLDSVGSSDDEWD